MAEELKPYYNKQCHDISVCYNKTTWFKHFHLKEKTREWHITQQNSP